MTALFIAIPFAVGFCAVGLYALWRGQKDVYRDR
jgi:nitrogen fixation-related uncharacterized protein